MSTPIQILQQYWNFDAFRNPQEEIIQAVVEGKDVMALLPTGGGKSLCYQVPTMMLDGICIVVAPLIALMQDQVSNLEKRGIKAAMLSSKLSKGEVNIIFDNLHFGNYKFLYLSPEKLQSKDILDRIKNLPVSLIAVDEAHCISEWGHDFRSSYLKIAVLKEIHPKVPLIALTATATPVVLEDIRKNLNLEHAILIKKSFYRENLAYQVFHIEDKFSKLTQLLQKFNAPAIIYVRYRKMTKELSMKLNNKGLTSNFYHGGLSVEQKETALNQWLNEQTPIMVATNAFGMGIDKPNVRLVIHLNIPSSIENYIQEAGRGGRDGKKSFSVVLIDNSDYLESEQQLMSSLPAIQFIKEVYLKLNQHFKIPYGEWFQEWFSFNIEEFCAHYGFSKNKVYHTLKMLESVEVLLLDENFDRKSTVSVIAGKHELFSYIERNEALGKLLQLLIRTYGGITDFTTTIKEELLAKKIGLTLENIKLQLQKLAEDEMITYVPANIHLQLQFLVPREDERTINLKSNEIKQRNHAKEKKFNDIEVFLKNTTTCRNIQLLHYFGEKNPSQCGTCDVCMAQKINQTKINEEAIINQLKDALQQPLSFNEINDLLAINKEELLNILQLLVEREMITLNLQNKFQLKNE